MYAISRHAALAQRWCDSTVAPWRAARLALPRQTWRTPDVAAPPRPMVRNAAGRDRSLPAWSRGTNFFKQNYPDHE